MPRFQTKNPPATPTPEPLALEAMHHRQRRDAESLLARGFLSDASVAQLQQDRGALMAEVERLRALPSPAPMKWPA